MITYDIVITAKLNVPGDGITDYDLRKMQNALLYESERAITYVGAVFPDDMQVSITRVEPTGQQ